MIGVENPIREFEAVELDWAILRPINSPFRFTKTPDPTAASLCIKCWYCLRLLGLAGELMMPLSTVFWSPRGSPIDTTKSPTRSWLESPKAIEPSSTESKSAESNLTTARSKVGSVPTKTPLNTCPVPKVILIDVAPRTACSLVNTYPACASIITPTERVSFLRVAEERL